MLLFILSLCGFSGALATRLLDPLITSIASDFATSVGVVAGGKAVRKGAASGRLLHEMGGLQ